ncbi:hypothetical protein D3C71_1583290 [compost metagenome]
MGSVVSGGFIDAVGLQGIMFSGGVFAALATVTIAFKIRRYPQIGAAVTHGVT